MKGSLIPAHRRPASASASADRPPRGANASALSVFLPEPKPSHSAAFSNPWAQLERSAGPRRPRPASAGIRRSIVDNGFALIGQNKSAAEISSAVRPASAKLAGRGGELVGASAGVRLEDYVPMKKLGQGASGSVHLAQLKNDGSYWVLKQVELGRAGSAPSSERNSAIARAERDNVLREVKLMSCIKSNNVINYCTSFLHQPPGGPQSVFIVMEYAEHGALSDHIKALRSRATKADESFIWKCMLQVSSGLAAIHAHRVIHRDIKSANILITGEQNFKIADLGIAVSTSLCNVQGRMRTGRCGTVGYMSPEVSNDMPYDARADMWSLGCVLYEIACHRVPFPAGTQVDTSVRVESGISMLEITEKANNLQLPHTYSDCLNNHVLWCLAVESCGRPTARELVSTKDAVRQAVELKVTLEQGFEYPTDPHAGRVEYRPDSSPAGKRRIGRAASARPASASALFAERGGAKQGAWAAADDDMLEDMGLSPIQGSPNRDVPDRPPHAPEHAAAKSARARPRPGSARAAAASSRAPRTGTRSASTSTAQARGTPVEQPAGDDKPADSYEAWQTASLRQAAKGLEGLGLQAASERDEEDLPETLRSVEQAAWERSNMHMLQALPGWQQESAFGGKAAQPEGVGPLSVGGKKKRIKKLTMAEKLAAAGAQRRMTKALRAVLAPTLESSGAMPLQKIEHLLVAQVGMPLVKMLSNAGPKGRACSLADFIVDHAEDFKVDAKNEVSLRHGDVRAGEKHSVASARILSTILSKDVGVALA